MPETAESKVNRLSAELSQAIRDAKVEKASSFKQRVEQELAGRCFLLKYQLDGKDKGESYAAVQYATELEIWHSEELRVYIAVKRVMVYSKPEEAKGREYFGPRIERNEAKDDLDELGLYTVKSSIIKEIDKKEFRRIWKMVGYVTRTFSDKMLNPPLDKPGLHPEHVPVGEQDPEFTELSL